MKAFARFLATLGPTGFAPIAPATAGSAVVTLIAWFVPVPPWPVVVALFVAGTAVAVWAAGIAEQTLGHDAGPIVIDEAVGQSLALVFVPHRIHAYILAFLLFRLFDIWKPLGAREAQRLPGGFGVVADDVIAGITASVAFHLLALGARFLFPHLHLGHSGPL
jgi:phosphatidylglycerophosphatase A